MESISIIINNKKIQESYFTDTSLFNYLNDFNYLDLHISPYDDVTIKFNNTKFILDYSQFYEMYSYGYKKLYTITYEVKKYFIFVDIIQYYKICFIKAIYVFKPSKI